MNRTALEMASSIGANPSEMGRDWQALGSLNLSNGLESLGRNIGIAESEWQKIISGASLWLMNGLDARIASMQKKVVEQETAMELRRTFGIPLSLLAMPVFVELEKMELAAKIDLKNEAALASELWEQINNRLLYMIQLFLAEQIEALEKESLAHQGALNESKKEAEGVESLSSTMSSLEEKFKAKMSELSDRKNLLLKAFMKVSDDLSGSVSRAFETTVFSAMSQNTAATLIQ